MPILSSVMKQAPVVGLPYLAMGMVTDLQYMAAGPPVLEDQLGFRRGRLSDGYWVLLLSMDMRAKDFQFAGTTRNSGGRWGNPLDDPKADSERVSVHEDMLETFKESGYQRIQDVRLKDYTTKAGAKRIAKVVTRSFPLADASPASEYPSSGRMRLQWRLPWLLPFTTVMFVNGKGLVTTPNFTLDLRQGRPVDVLERRTRIARYLESFPLAEPPGWEADAQALKARTSRG